MPAMAGNLFIPSLTGKPGAGCTLNTAVIDLPMMGSTVQSKPAITAGGTPLEHVVGKSTRQLKMTCTPGARVEISSLEPDGVIRDGANVLYQHTDLEIEIADTGSKIASGDLGRRPIFMVSDGSPVNLVLTSYVYSQDGRAAKAISFSRSQNLNFLVN